jgi:hypothetical protein
VRLVQVKQSTDHRVKMVRPHHLLALLMVVAVAVPQCLVQVAQGKTEPQAAAVPIQPVVRPAVQVFQAKATTAAQVYLVAAAAAAAKVRLAVTVPQIRVVLAVQRQPTTLQVVLFRTRAVAAAAVQPQAARQALMQAQAA